MKRIVGLGNVGKEYARTRHNVGFMVVEQLAADHGAAWTTDRQVNARCAAIPKLGAQLLEPQTMMNLSGASVAAAQRRRPGETLIVIDDVNLPLGALRLRPAGSDGGHHGLLSCLEALGTLDVPRLRVGVGAERMPRDLADFVLGPFSKEETSVLHAILGKAVEACELWAARGIESAMNFANATHDQ